MEHLFLEQFLEQIVFYCTIIFPVLCINLCINFVRKKYSIKDILKNIFLLLVSIVLMFFICLPVLYYIGMDTVFNWLYSSDNVVYVISYIIGVGYCFSIAFVVRSLLKFTIKKSVFLFKLKYKNKKDKKN